MRTYPRRRPQCQVIEGVHELCRLCLQKPNESLPIFDKNSDDIYPALSLRIMICVGLEIAQEESLPNMICTECYQELSKCYTFRKKCEKSYLKLKHHIEAISNSCKKKLKKENITEKLNENRLTIDESKHLSFENLPENLKIDLQGDNDTNTVTPAENRTVNPETADAIDIVEIEDIQENTSQSDQEDVNLDVTTFLSSILVQMSVIAKQDEKLSIIDPSVNTIEFIMGGDNSVTLELVEEDEEIVDTVTKISDTSQLEANLQTNKAVKQVSTNNTEVKNGQLHDTAVAKDCKADVRGWCSNCDKWLANAAALRRHQLVHSGERPYTCRECGRAFAQTATLKRHQLMHLERRPFQCPKCPKSFTQRGALEKHLQIHSPPQSRAMMLYRCTKCPKVFLYHSSLCRHMLVHKGFVFMCGGCDRTFNDKSSLLRHVRNKAHNVDKLDDKSGV